MRRASLAAGAVGFLNAAPDIDKSKEMFISDLGVLLPIMGVE